MGSGEFGGVYFHHGGVLIGKSYRKKMQKRLREGAEGKVFMQLLLHASQGTGWDCMGRSIRLIEL